jgi:hypothetical protein
VAGALVYLNSFHGVFLFDDERFILENDRVCQFWPPWEWFANPENLERPVITLTLAANYLAGGRSAWGYHAFNLSVHLLAALALFGIARRTLVSERLRERFAGAATPLALCVALLWLVHPLQTQSVTYIWQRCESLMGLFFLLTLYCVIRGFGSARAGRWHAAAVCCCVLGAGCKQVMVMAVPVVLLYDIVFLSGTVRAVLRRWRLYAGLGMSWVLLALVTAFGTSVKTGLTICTPWEYARSQPGVVLQYLRLALWPDTLCLDYWWPVARTVSEVLPGALVIGGLLAATAWALWRAPAWEIGRAHV